MCPGGRFHLVQALSLYKITATFATCSSEFNFMRSLDLLLVLNIND